MSSSQEVFHISSSQEIFQISTSESICSDAEDQMLHNINVMKQLVKENYTQHKYTTYKYLYLLDTSKECNGLATRYITVLLIYSILLLLLLLLYHLRSPLLLHLHLLPLHHIYHQRNGPRVLRPV